MFFFRKKNNNSYNNTIFFVFLISRYCRYYLGNKNKINLKKKNNENKLNLKLIIGGK
jgi:hypothetical protein